MPQLGQGKHLVNPPAEAVLRLALSIPSMVMDDHLFVEKLGLEGVVGQEVGLVKATVILVMLMHQPNCLHQPPHQFGSTSSWVHVPILLPSRLQLVCYSPLRVTMGN